MESLVLVEGDDALSSPVSKSCAKGTEPLKLGTHGLTTPGGALVHSFVLGAALDGDVRGSGDVGQEPLVDLGPVNCWEGWSWWRSLLWDWGYDGGCMGPDGPQG